MEMAKKIIIHQLEDNPLVLSGYKPEILVEDITDTSISLKVGVWISNINREGNFRSDFLTRVYDEFKLNHIEWKS
jgi:small-conductance mechanosensitive channel